MTGRPDTPNLITNALVLPGIFRGALDVRARGIYEALLLPVPPLEEIPS